MNNIFTRLMLSIKKLVYPAYFRRQAKAQAQETIKALYSEFQAHHPEISNDTVAKQPVRSVIAARILNRARTRHDAIHALHANTVTTAINKGSTKLKHRMSKLKQLMNTPFEANNKKAKLTILRKIDALLTDEVAFETIHQQRWQSGVQCPSCASFKVSRRGVNPVNPFCRIYKCDLCGFHFDDLTGSGLSSYVRSIRQWLLCWHYLDFELAPEEIAKLMGVSIEVVEKMAEVLKKALPHEPHDMHHRYHLDSEKHLNDEQARILHKRRLNAHSLTAKK